jgi:hypothetical protein
MHCTNWEQLNIWVGGGAELQRGQDTITNSIKDKVDVSTGWQAP